MMSDSNQQEDNAKKKTRSQPAWIKPSGIYKTGLFVKNSLTRSNEEFIPENGNQVKWYICGPTVYDSAHLGHARCYLTFDIIRRILEDYFGYEIQSCINITDIDDKIIVKSRKDFFLSEWRAKNLEKSLENTHELSLDFREQILEALDFNIGLLSEKHERIIQDIKSGECGAKEASPELDLVKSKLEDSRLMRSKVDSSSDHKNLVELVECSKEIKDSLGEWLDERRRADLSPELLKKITKKLSLHYEREFIEDIKALGIRMPDVLTRVSEYIEEIIEMVQEIVENGFGYESEGSVYFDTTEFDKNEMHFYAKLVPTNFGNLTLLSEGEGILSNHLKKRSPNDFALWKKSKPGEPGWNSPWSVGRPGWHIECSAMAGKIFGDKLDIHAGGIDLRFPHHDNELAQSEAYFGCNQWVNYFLHSGHLHIDGMKMSKSLKNFITIRQVLKDHPPHRLRLLFLLQSWDDVMNYQRENTMDEVIAKEKAWNDLFMRVNKLSIDSDITSNDQKWDAIDISFNSKVLEAQEKTHLELCNNFNTSAVMKLLSSLTTDANKYFLEKTRKPFLLHKAASFINKILRIFGVFQVNQICTFGSNESQENQDIKPIVEELVRFRTQVREALKEGNPKPALFRLCDDFRDEVAPNLGIKIVDDSEFGYFFVDLETLKKEREERKKQILEKKMKKERLEQQKKLKKEKQELEKKLGKT